MRRGAGGREAGSGKAAIRRPPGTEWRSVLTYRECEPQHVGHCARRDGHLAFPFIALETDAQAQSRKAVEAVGQRAGGLGIVVDVAVADHDHQTAGSADLSDRKSTRLNSSH